MRCARLVWLATVDRRLKGAGKVKKWMRTNFCILFSHSLSVSRSSLFFCLSLGSALYINDTFANTVAQRKSLCVYGFVCLPLPFYPPSLLLPFSARLPATFGVHFALVFVCSAWAAVPHFIIHNDWYTRWLQRTRREATRLMCTHLSAGRGKGETRKSVVGRDWQRQRLKSCNAKYRHS